MPSSLQSNELSQWTQGEPDLIAKLLFNLFCFLKEATNKKKDATEYKKIMENIASFISLQGEQRLHIPQASKAAIDASALLGAYLRLGIKLNDKPIVELSDEQIDIVHAFVKPLVPEGFTPQQFFDSLDGSPSEKHKKILKLLIFKDITPEHPKELFEGKYADKVHNLLESILSLADFMRTPFGILPEEEKAAIAAAKKTGKGPQTSGIDLQWTSMCKAIEQSLQDIIALKKGKAKQALLFSDEIKASLEQCRKCFGIANARYEVIKEFGKETKKHEEVLTQTFKVLGFSDGNQEKINQYISDFRKSLIAKENDPEKALALQTMTLTQLINVYGAQWQAALDKFRKELDASQKELDKANITLEQTRDTLEESNKQLLILRQEHEKLKHEGDEASKKLDQQSLELVRLQKVESTSKATIENQKIELEKTRLTVQQNSASLEKLNKQLQVVQKENEELKRNLISEQKHEQTIAELKKQLEELRRENGLLQQQLEKEQQVIKSSSEIMSEVTQLKSQLESLRKENDSLVKRIEKEKQIQEPEIDVNDLKVQLESLRLENAQLKELLLKAKQPIPEPERLIQPVELPADNNKPDLFIALGRLRLNKEDTGKIKQEIMDCNDKESLSNIVTKIKRLEKINDLIETVNKGILSRAGFFSTDPHKKVEAIETAFQQMSIEDKNKLATLTVDEINGELSTEKGKESDIGKLLKAIHHKRGRIAIRSATSFAFFKSEIGHLKHDLDEINTPIQSL